MAIWKPNKYLHEKKYLQTSEKLSTNRKWIFSYLHSISKYLLVPELADDEDGSGAGYPRHGARVVPGTVVGRQASGLAHDHIQLET